ncbi:MAG: homocysteine S-methyltransferase family protein, partial [Oscillospiraceae bacterium]|nr:homocysteine S-methyltransferase family protein [Oscillospiraceae bacterium]
MLAKDYIKYKAPLLLDGAMGTYYSSLPGCEAKRVEAANIDEPEQISAIHRAYLEAGSKAIKTNTFSLSSDIAQRTDNYAFKIIDAA